MADVTPTTEISIVYLGQRLMSDNKLAKLYIPLVKLMEYGDDQDNKDIERFASLFEHKRTEKKSPRIIAGHYKMKCVCDEAGRINRCYAGSATFVDMVPHPFRTVWDALDDAALMSFRAANQLKKLEDKSYLKDDMNRLRAYYEQVPYADRPAFEMVVLKALRSGIK